MRLMNWVALAWMAGAGMVSAQQGPEQGIIVTGQGSVAAAPDMATITLGVTEEAASAKAAMDKVTEAVAAILAQLDAQGIAAKDRQTSRFYLRPVHDRRPIEDGAPPRITGYEAGNSVTVWTSAFKTPKTRWPRRAKPLLLTPPNAPGNWPRPRG